MHIGERIREVFDQQPRTHTAVWFAKQLNCDRRNIYKIFSRNNIDILLLLRISRILQHDFFKELSAEVQDAATALRTNKRLCVTDK